MPRLLLWSWLMLLIPAVAWAAVKVKHSVESERWSDEYDHFFRKYSKHYFGPHFNWKWFKAQAIAESGLNAAAKSPVGAIGVMQIMPATYKEIVESNPHLAKINEPKWNIAAGVYYDRYLYRKWRKKNFPVGERISFTFASYNAGYGGVLRAYKKAKNKHGKIREWRKVEDFAPKETRHYVKRINGLMK